MGHHLTKDGEFNSDKYTWCPPGFFALKFSDPTARLAINEYIKYTEDNELGKDLRKAVENAEKRETAQPMKFIF